MTKSLIERARGGLHHRSIGETCCVKLEQLFSESEGIEGLPTEGVCSLLSSGHWGQWPVSRVEWWGAYTPSVIWVWVETDALR